MRRTGLLVWLFAASARPPRDTSWRAVHAQSLVLLDDEMTTLQSQLVGVRAAHDASAAAAGLAERRVSRLEEQLAGAQSDIAALRAELAALREELVWAFAERRPGLTGAADLDGSASRTAAAGPVAVRPLVVRPVAGAG